MQSVHFGLSVDLFHLPVEVFLFPAFFSFGPGSLSFSSLGKMAREVTVSVHQYQGVVQYRKNCTEVVVKYSKFSPWGIVREINHKIWSISQLFLQSEIVGGRGEESIVTSR